MAKQDGPVPIRGRVGEIVFYKGREGYLAKGAGSLDRKRVLKDPAFAGSRKASAAFGHAAKCAGLLRRAMGGQTLKLAETRMSGRLNKLMLDIIKTDTSTDSLDQKRVYRGHMDMLKGFAWHRDKRLAGTLKTGYRVDMDKRNGSMAVHFDAFAPRKGLKAPAGATHFELFASGAAPDFEKMEVKNDCVSSGALVINGSSTGIIDLNCAVGSGNRLPLVVGLGIMFYQEVSGQTELLADSSCFEIVGMEG